jgi:hypothetical protein
MMLVLWCMMCRAPKCNAAELESLVSKVYVLASHLDQEAMVLDLLEKGLTTLPQLQIKMGYGSTPDHPKHHPFCYHSSVSLSVGTLQHQ